MNLKRKIKDFITAKHKNSIANSMGWVTIYITGKGDFREDVGRKLEDSDLKLMPGYTGGSTGETDLITDMYWIDDKIKIRDVKEAVGSKLIWKHRLRFYTSLESFIESQNTKKNTGEFTAEERALLAEIQASVYREAS
jgi:hypothetical protein